MKCHRNKAASVVICCPVQSTPVYFNLSPYTKRNKKRNTAVNVSEKKKQKRKSDWKKASKQVHVI